MAQESSEDELTNAVQRAVGLVAEAMDLLDTGGDCPDAAMHLDHALRYMRQHLATAASERRAPL